MTKKILLTLIVLFFSGHAQPGLTLGGHFIPQDSFMVFINMGNSAMSGRDSVPDFVTEPHLWKFEMSPANYDWLLAKEPICVDANQTMASPKGGPIMPFLKALHTLYPSYYFGVMQLSGSGWELQGHFNPGSSSVNALLTQANLLMPNVTIAGIVSMLNLVEVQDNDTANYVQKVTAMVSNIRTKLGLAYSVPYIHAGYPVMAAGVYDTSLAATKSIIRQIAVIPDSVSDCVVIPTDSLTVCMSGCVTVGSHYDHGGNVGWGNRTADSVKARNWIPPDMPVSVSPYRRQILGHSSSMQRVMFDGNNRSAFGKAGKSFDIYSLDGKIIGGTSSAALKNARLLPGIYFVRTDGSF